MHCWTFYTICLPIVWLGILGSINTDDLCAPGWYEFDNMKTIIPPERESSELIANAPDLETCKQICMAQPLCMGIEYDRSNASDNRCFTYKQRTWLQDIITHNLTDLYVLRSCTDHYTCNITVSCESVCHEVCGCDAGYTLDRLGHECLDVDECQSVTLHNCGHAAVTCDNHMGGYMCVCAEGFHMVGDDCEDVDECHQDEKIPCEQECVNSAGSYTCHCSEGYFENDLQKCQEEWQSPGPKKKAKHWPVIGIIIAVVVVVVVVGLLFCTYRYKLLRRATAPPTEPDMPFDNLRRSSDNNLMGRDMGSIPATGLYADAIHGVENRIYNELHCEKPPDKETSEYRVPITDETIPRDTRKY